jgi:hypothetical protein
MDVLHFVVAAVGLSAFTYTPLYLIARLLCHSEFESTSELNAWRKCESNIYGDN